VVFKTDERLRLERFDVGVDDDIADESLLARLGGHVDHADARKFFALAGLVVVAQ